MATIFFSSLGSALGGAVGWPSVGKLLGTRLGQYIDKKLFQTSKTRQVFSYRLEDLAVQSSTYGRMINICYGQMRLAGNIIWASSIREVVSTEVFEYGGGQKGIFGYRNVRKRLEKVQYDYFVDFALAICEGQIDQINKIWADNILLDPASLNMRIYYGSEDQLPDSIISVHMGAQSTPAFRGLAYVVIENLHLNPYGKRIPNFTFEVQRALKNPNSLEHKIAGINLIPGTGEFVYDPRIIFKSQIDYIDGIEIKQMQRQRVNNSSEHNNLSDSMLSLRQMQQVMPKIGYVNVVVGWFASSLNLADLQIYPAIEFRDVFHENEQGEAINWSVAGVNRVRARLVGRDPSNPFQPNYGGTPDDDSLRFYLIELKKMGYKVILYPILFVDLPNKPWRGHISGQAQDLEKFFKGLFSVDSNNKPKNNFSYFEFIMHYAQSFNGLIDGLIIGSEFKKITNINITNANGHLEFPAIKYFKELADLVRKKAFNSDIQKIITYAADWSEYHSENGYFYMDDLWSDANINCVGIDAYFPLTDEASYSFMPSYEELLASWHSGVGYHYYYDENGKKQEYNNPAYAWKNLEYWWANKHYNPNQTKPTNWQPRMKKIWFTEYGFPSVHGASNSPNVFYNPASIDGGFPKYSNTSINFDLQALCLEASIDYWQSHPEKMVEQMFIWCYDARPYPYYPLLKKQWSDSDLWMAGHWINGKLGNVQLKDVIWDLLIRTRLIDFFNFHQLKIVLQNINVSIMGMVLNNSEQSIADVLNFLGDLYSFDFIEGEEGAYVDSRIGRKITATIPPEDMMCDEKQNILNIECLSEMNLASKINLNYLSADNAYEVHLVSMGLDQVDLDI